MFTDSHCHLNCPELASKLPAVLQAMQESRVDRALCIATTLEEFGAVHAMALAHPNIWATVGVHPDSAGVVEPELQDLLKLGRLPRVVGIGETGLDYYRLSEQPQAAMARQRHRFRVHIRAARLLGLPLVIHTRSAAHDTLALLREEGEDGTAGCAGGVFHCFTESAAVARAALDLGFYISFSGILTFKNAQDLREIAAFVPPERLLIETDSPYLAPAPHRGKTNNPSYVALIAACLGEIRQCPVEAIGRVTSANFERLFCGVLR